jgi:hypothetical protein
VIYTIAPFLILAVWFGLKLLQFQSPNQSFADAHITLQLSKGWMEGRPFLYDTYYGHHDQIHNYFFIAFLGPITWFTGIYGLFGIYILLMAGLFVSVRRTIRRWRDRYAIGLSVLLLGLGPFSYFVFIDVFGWHPEQYFLPLMGFLALALVKKKWTLAIFLLLLVSTIKESAPILWCGLLLFASITDSILRQPTASVRTHLLSKTNWLIVTAALLLFLAGLVWLSAKSDGPSRLTTALRVPLRAPIVELLTYCLKFAVPLILLLVTLGLPLFAILKKLKGGRILASYLIFYLCVLGAAFWVEGLIYFPDFDATLVYPTRAGSLLAFFFSCYLYLLVRTASFREPVSVTPSLWSVIFQITFSSVLVFHSWTLIDARKDLGKLLHHALSGFQGDPYQDEDRVMLKKLAKNLPRGSEVVAPERYLSLFQKYYGARPERQQWLLGQPILIVCERNETSVLSPSCEFSTNTYQLYKGKQNNIWINRLWESQLTKSLE